jgi:LasA protease
MKKRLAFIILIAWLLPALACNYPVASSSPQGVSGQELRQTLAASEPGSEVSPTTVPVIVKTPEPDDFPGLFTATPGNIQDQATPEPGNSDSTAFFDYIAQSGDTLPALAKRFGVEPDQIASAAPLPAEAFITPGQPLRIPDTVDQIQYPSALLPDSEVVDSPAVAGFDIQAFIQNAGGYLSTYREQVDEKTLSGAEIVQRIALDYSISPKILLAFLEYRSHWVYGQPSGPDAINYPIGFRVPGETGLYTELLFTAKQLNIGYYGWRAGTLTTIKFLDQSTARLDPRLNAGTITVQRLFSLFYKRSPWQGALYGTDSFINLFTQMFGDPWAEAARIEPLFPAGLAQPPLELPFSVGERWSFSGGPHAAWDTGSPLGALDFSPVTGQAPCVVPNVWVTASAAGVVTRSDHNLVAVDLDGDGSEQTGWVLIYYHVADKERVSPGTRVSTDDHIGHPSCEGGKTTGTHVHIARKYNGEWLPAAGPLPFVLSGWQVVGGTKIYEGSLVKGDKEVVASPVGPQTSIIVRQTH